MLLQTGVAGLVGGFVLIAVLSTLLANTAAYFVTNDTQLRESILPGVALALVAMTAVVLPMYVVAPLAIVVDYVACRFAFGLDTRATAIVAAVHYALTLSVNFLVQSTLALYQTAPG